MSAADTATVERDDFGGLFLSAAYEAYLIEKLGLSNDLDEARLRIRECLRMLLLLPQSKGNIPVSSEIDEVWHWMILETREYFQLCESLPSRIYLHHRSVVFDRCERQLPLPFVPSPTERFEILKNRLSWLVSYRKHFGPFEEKVLRFWPLTKELMRDQKLGLNQLNDRLCRVVQN